MQQTYRDALLTSTGGIRWYTTDTAGREPYRILDVREVDPRRNTLIAWLRVSMPANDLTLVLDGCGLHVQNGKAWCSPPGAAWIKAGALVLDPRGRVQYSPVVTFSHGGQRLWSEQIVLALRRSPHADLLPLDEDAQHEADVAAAWFGKGGRA